MNWGTFISMTLFICHILVHASVECMVLNAFCKNIWRYVVQIGSDMASGSSGHEDGWGSGFR